MSCSKCRINPCNTCKKCDRDCEQRVTIDWVPNTACTIGITFDGITDTLALVDGIQNCETKTHIAFNKSVCGIEYKNELYEATDGAEGYIETIYATDIASCINLEDLANVEDEVPENCALLVYRADSNCGHGCTGIEDTWMHWYAAENLIDGVHWLAGFTADGCLAALDAPADSCSLLVFDPDCEGNEEWKPYTIPNAETCELEAEDGYYKVLKKNDCGCIEECKLPVVPAGMTALNYERDSVPDDPDFPWYYGNYNDHINLHLAENAPTYFGKYDLKVTVNYGVQAIKSDLFDYNYNWRSLVVPVVEGDIVRTTQCASILQNWGMSAIRGTGAGQVTWGIPWGSSSLRGSFTFIVPKGKEAYLHHEYRIRTNESSKTYDYFYTPVDGKRVPDSEAQINSILYPASRLNALQVIIEPTQGSTSYEPATDPYRGQLDSPVDTYPQDL